MSFCCYRIWDLFKAQLSLKLPLPKVLILVRLCSPPQKLFENSSELEGIFNCIEIIDDQRGLMVRFRRLFQFSSFPSFRVWFLVCFLGLGFFSSLILWLLFLFCFGKKHFHYS